MSEWQHRIPSGFHTLHGTPCSACGHPLHRFDAVLIPLQSHQDCSQARWEPHDIKRETIGYYKDD